MERKSLGFVALFEDLTMRAIHPNEESKCTSEL